MDELDDQIQQLPLNLYRTAIAIRGEITRKLTANFGKEFTADYWFILSVLFEHGSLEQNKLSELMNRDAASISRSISCMERIDLVTRQKKSPTSRNTSILPTKHAHEFKPQAEQIIKETLGLSLGKLKPIEIMEFNRILTDIFEQC